MDTVTEFVVGYNSDYYIWNFKGYDDIKESQRGLNNGNLLLEWGVDFHLVLHLFLLYSK